MAKQNRTENELEAIREFTENWILYMKMFKAAHHGTELTRDAEAKFLKLKSTLARRHQYLLDNLEDDYVAGESITPLLSLCVNLQVVSRVHRSHYADIETKWHDTFLALNETMGRLRQRLQGDK